MKMTRIYILIDPRDGRIMYVGKADDEKIRLYRHLLEATKTNCKHTYKNNWLKSLLKQELIPVVEVIDDVLDSEWQFWEKHYISLYRSWGFNLTNETDGGDGGRMPDYVRQKMKASAKLRPSPMTGKKHTEEAKRNMAIGHIRSIAFKKGLIPREYIPKIKKEKIKRIFKPIVKANFSECFKINKNLTKTEKKQRKRLTWIKKMCEGYIHPHRNKKLPEEHKEKLRLNAKNNPNYGMRGKKRSKEASERTGFKNRGRKASPETIEKLRISHLGQKGWMEGKNVPEETKKKISEKLKEYYNSHAHVCKGKEIPQAIKSMRLGQRKEKQAKNIELVLNSSIDFSKSGWVKKVSHLINKSHQKVHFWMKQYIPGFYNEKCFKRNPRIKESQEQVDQIKELVEKNIPYSDISKLTGLTKTKIGNIKRKNIAPKTEDKNIQLVLNSGIDFSKQGWIEKVATLLGKKYHTVNYWMRTYMPEFHKEKCYKINRLPNDAILQIKSLVREGVPTKRIIELTGVKDYIIHNYVGKFKRAA